MKTKEMTPQEKALFLAKKLKKLLKQANEWAKNPYLQDLKITLEFKANAVVYEPSWEPIDYENETTKENI